jgi:hypothetical protein
MAQGYSFDLVEANKRASAKNIGVALGRVCIKARVPVTQVAGHFAVSRMTIYNWFKGDGVPLPARHGYIREHIAALKNKTHNWLD